MVGEGSFGNDFLGVLIKAHHDADENQMISIDEIVDECKTFYFGGQETTSSGLAWTVFLLAIHTDWQEEARKEVIQIFGKQNPNLDGIAKLKIVRMSTIHSFPCLCWGIYVTMQLEVLRFFFMIHFSCR